MNFDYNKLKVLSQIQKCARNELGYVMSNCVDCGHQEFVANCVCNNRHCPSCGAAKRGEWTEKVSDRNFASSYFHVVFTLPHELNKLILKFPREILDLLCKESANTLLQFAKDPKYLGGTPFLITVLHTWTQDLKFHPHVHCLISAGALSPCLTQWQEPKNKKFLFPVHALAKNFKGKFLSGLERLINEEKISFGPEFQHCLGVIDFLSKFPKKWNVYSKPPYKGKEVVLKYFANYTNRSGISDSRLIDVKEDKVLIKPKRDSAEPEFNSKEKALLQGKKIIVLNLIEFFRRFFLHILPRGFHRIRHYGLASPRCAENKIEVARKLLGKELSKTKKSMAVKIKTTSPCSQCGSPNIYVICVREHKTFIMNKKERIDTS